MSLEKFLRTHAATFERKPWLPIEEQVEEAFEDAVREAASQAEDDADERAAIAYDNGHWEGGKETKEEIFADLERILEDKKTTDQQKIKAIEEYMR